jgi:hypothetical protein
MMQQERMEDSANPNAVTRDRSLKSSPPAGSSRRARLDVCRPHLPADLKSSILLNVCRCWPWKRGRLGNVGASHLYPASKKLFAYMQGRKQQVTRGRTAIPNSQCCSKLKSHSSPAPLSPLLPKDSGEVTLIYPSPLVSSILCRRVS